MANCRGCGRLIVWTKMQSGKPMPCDPEVIWFTTSVDKPELKESFVTPEGEVVSGIRMSRLTTIGCGKSEWETRIGYISHFATCPMSKQFKKG